MFKYFLAKWKVRKERIKAEKKQEEDDRKFAHIMYINKSLREGKK